MKQKYRWIEEEKQIYCLDGDTVVFKDTLDHWANGFCRLPNLKDGDARSWIEASNNSVKKKGEASLREASAEDAIVALGEGWHQLYPEAKVDPKAVNLDQANPGSCGHRPDSLFASAIGEDPNYAVAHCSICGHGWLIDRHDPGRVLRDVVEYDKDYFEGDTKRLGYGSYIKQQGWRLEKAERLIRQLDAALMYRGVSLPKEPTLLDVGSGYGFFRQTAEKVGYAHQGIEISRHAAEVTKELFGFDTFIGTLETFDRQNQGNERFDVITFYDVIEHVEDPLSTLQVLKSLLRPGGVCMLRTPNLHCVEQRIFGNFFYSLKKEHYNLFSPESLSLFCDRAGLKPLLTTTTAHYLQGILGSHTLYYEAILAGSDILVLAQNEY